MLYTVPTFHNPTGASLSDKRRAALVALADAEGGIGHSAESVRTRIKTLIEAEPATAVLSDDRIAEILRTEGIEIARRTVAKYRESLRIPSSSQRRRARALQLR